MLRWVLLGVVSLSLAGCGPVNINLPSSSVSVQPPSGTITTNSTSNAPPSPPPPPPSPPPQPSSGGGGGVVGDTLNR